MSRGLLEGEAHITNMTAFHATLQSHGGRMDKKLCSGCKKILCVDLFSKDKYQKSGLRCKCKDCSSKEFSSFKNGNGYQKRLLKTSANRKDLKSVNPVKVWSHTAYHNAKRRAKAAGCDFTITKSWLEENAVKICPLLNVLLDYNAEISSPNVASIDRKNSECGYTPENCKIISFKANRIKNNASIEEISLLAKNLKEY
jgi:hypothetical protein